MRAWSSIEPYPSTTPLAGGPGEGGIVFAPLPPWVSALQPSSRTAGGLSPASGQQAFAPRPRLGGVRRGEWRPGVSPNGQRLIRDNRLGPTSGPDGSPRPPAGLPAEHCTVGETAAWLTEYNKPKIPRPG